jgi:hypothetical protein
MSKRPSAPWQKNKEAITPEAHANKESDSAPGQAASKFKIPQAPSNPQKPENRWYKTIDGWKTALEILAIPFAVGYAMVTYYQWQDLRRNFATEQRAWVFVQNGEINVHGAVGEMLATDLTVTNTGKTPAEHITGNVILTVLFGNEAIDTEYSDGYLQFPVSSGTVLPNVPQKFRITGVVKPKNGRSGNLIIDESFGQALNAGLARIVLYGRLDYLDVNGRQHWVTFCNHMGGYARVPGCAEYNAIDHNW